MKKILILIMIMMCFQVHAITFWKNNDGKAEKIDAAAFDSCSDDLKVYRGNLLIDQLLSVKAKSGAIKAAVKDTRNKTAFGPAQTLFMGASGSCTYGTDGSEEDFSKK